MYSSDYIIVEKKKLPLGAQDEWTCYLRGERVGEIRSNRETYRKPFTAYIFDIPRGMTRVGEFDTLYEAKRALDKPAREYLQIEAERNARLALLPAEDREFFPTPSYIAGKLLSMINWRGVKSVLEPSAGRGDLIEYASRFKIRGLRSYDARVELRDVDCIEIDPNLQALLVGKGYRVVHDDFLTYYTRKQYDLIIMNPPFSEGADHLLHALELASSGGQIACILNAETLRNPYTVSRKALLKELRRRNASIVFVRDAFGRAERRARVDVALVYVNIPCENVDNSLWESLKKARAESIERETATDVAPADQIERMIREYDLTCEGGIALMRCYNGLAPHIKRTNEKGSFPLIALKIADKTTSYEGCSSEEINIYLRAVRARYWSELFDLPPLRRRMTSKMRDDYSNTISEMCDYEFSRFNINQVLTRIDGQLTQGVEDAILKCFDKLSAEHTYNRDIQNDNIHYYNGWKTNKAHYVNMKCIIPTYGCFAKDYKEDKYGRYKETLEGLDVRGCFSVLDDLEKALNYLDKGETTETSLEYELRAAAANARTANIPCKFFDVTFYKKGTCHIKFRDQKIVDRLNIYVGRQKAWLPPTYGSVSYEEMDDESKRVVDEFQGREQYEAVFAAPTEYIIETKAAPLMLG